MPPRVVWAKTYHCVTAQVRAAGPSWETYADVPSPRIIRTVVSSVGVFWEVDMWVHSVSLTYAA